MKKAVLLYLLIIPGILSHAQQLPQFTQFREMMSYHNPAAAGAFGWVAGIAGRQQWVNLKDSVGNRLGPESYMIFADLPLEKTGSGVGILGMHDRMGIEQTSYARINAAQHFRLGREHTLSVGASVDYLSKQFDYNMWNSVPAMNPESVFTGKVRAGGFDVGAGLLFSNSSGTFAGVSAHNLLQSALAFPGFNYRNARQYQFMAGMALVLAASRNFRLDLLPAVLVKTTENMSPQFDLQAGLRINEKLYAGISYRHEDAIGLVAGLSLQYFRIGLSYDYTTSLLRTAGSMGSPEMVVSYVRPLHVKKRWEGICF